MPTTPAPAAITGRTIAFLRRLKRNNDRDWFRAHRDEYARDVQTPMIGLLERLAGDFRRFAPDLVASPRISLYRIYRDTRFSPDKSPLKTHVAAVFPHRDLSKHEGAGLYLEIGPTLTRFGGGLYMPAPVDLHRLRAHIAANFDALREIVESPGFRRTFGRVHGDALQRVPRGFAADHPARDFLKLRQFLAVVAHPPEFAASRRFYPALIDAYRRLYPLVRFLNGPLLANRRASADPLRAHASGPSRA